MSLLRSCAAAVTAAGIALVVVATGADADTGVTADDGAGAFVIRSNVDGATGPGSGCPGCAPATVIAVPVCVAGVQFASPQPGSGCLSWDGRCPDDQEFVREWTAGAGVWIEGGVDCQDLGSVPTVAQIGAGAADEVRRRVPRPTISTQPRSGALIRLPILLDSGQPQDSLRWRVTVLGVAVTVEASAHWQWTFDDGSRLDTGHSGSRWPDAAVSHTFASAGIHDIALTTEWQGTFTIPGLAPRPIPSGVTQTSRVRVPVTEARAVLRPVN